MSDVAQAASNNVAPVFMISAICGFCNFILSLLVFPESLGRRRQPSSHDNTTASEVIPRATLLSTIKGFFTPLAIFLPLQKANGTRDWNLTFVALSLFGYLLAAGIYQIKYLYAEHIYGWDTVQLSYFVSILAGTRALTTLCILPIIIAYFKPKRNPGIAKTPTPPGSAPPASHQRARPTRSALLSEISFDLLLVKASIVMDISSHSLVFFTSTPPATVFTAFSALSSFGAGLVPAIQSVALCIIQIQGEDGNVGRLFGALSVLQAVGQMIIGPFIFGMVYSTTVAKLPKTIFALAAAILVFSLVATLLIRPTKRTIPRDEVERGRPRNNKALRGSFTSTNT